MGPMIQRLFVFRILRGDAGLVSAGLFADGVCVRNVRETASSGDVGRRLGARPHDNRFVRHSDIFGSWFESESRLRTRTKSSVERCSITVHE